MKQLVVLSGKGGTGKTSLVASFASLAENAIMVDADVDAADLHLILTPTVKEDGDYVGGQEAIIDADACIGCGMCSEVCSFDAIREAGDVYEVDGIQCEGCGFCARICPEEAIRMEPAVSGKWFVSDTRFGPFVHARLGIAAENSGKLVSHIREKAKEKARTDSADLIVIDGSPGVGCPVIASATGADMAVVITEPSVSGLHDLERLMQLLAHFKIPACSVVNKADLDMEMTEKIEEACRGYGVRPIGRIPFDPTMVKAMIAKSALVEYSSGKSAVAIREIWEKVQGQLALLDEK